MLITVVPDLTFKSGRIYEIKCGRIRIWEELVLGSQNNTPDETNGINNAVGFYKEAAQFSASSIMSVFASFDEISGMTMDFVLFSSE